VVLHVLERQDGLRELAATVATVLVEVRFLDINRDTHQQTHETTKAVHRMFHEWHPTVVHDLHEAVPLLMSWNEPARITRTSIRLRTRNFWNRDFMTCKR